MRPEINTALGVRTPVTSGHNLAKCSNQPEWVRLCAVVLAISALSTGTLGFRLQWIMVNCNFLNRDYGRRLGIVDTDPWFLVDVAILEDALEGAKKVFPAFSPLPAIHFCRPTLRLEELRADADADAEHAEEGSSKS
ncbi:hypothetical protein PMIN03_002734 [Paraphaeosphaeria minitans]